MELDRRVVSRISHDLKSPLASVREALTLLEAGKLGSLDPRQQKVVSLCRRNADRLWSSLAKLAEWVRLRQGLVEFETGPADLTAILRRARQQVEGGEGWDVNGPEGPLPVEGDRGRIEQMFVELLDNAARFAPERGVRVVLERNGRTAVLQVSHPGTDLRDVPREHLLEPFYPQRTGSGSGGLGLGLDITRMIARAHGGTLEWECSERGTVFRLRLPVPAS